MEKKINEINGNKKKIKEHINHKWKIDKHIEKKINEINGNKKKIKEHINHKWKIDKHINYQS